MRKRSGLGRLVRCERGNSLLVSAAALPLLIGSAALAYDTVQLAVWIQQLEEVTDASAIAGAEALAGGRPVASAVDRKIGEDPRVRIIPPVIVRTDTADPRPRVRVALTSQRSLPFLSAMMNAPATRSAEAEAFIDKEEAVRLAR